MNEKLKEFLVALGFKVDDAGWKKFRDSVATGTKQVMELGAAVAVSTEAVQLMVTRISEQFEDLYYASVRTGSSVTHLQSFGYAAKQIGVEAGDAQAMVDGFAESLRLQPGLAGMLGGLGVNPSEPDKLKQMIMFLDKIKSMPFYQQAAYANMFGIDPKSLFMLQQQLPLLIAFEKDHAQRLKDAGVNAEEAGVKSLEFDRALRKMEDDFGIAAMRLGLDLMPGVEKLIKGLDYAAQGFNALDDDTNGWLYTIAGVGSTVIAGYLGKLLLLKLFFKEAVAASVEAAAGIEGVGTASVAAGAAVAASVEAAAGIEGAAAASVAAGAAAAPFIAIVAGLTAVAGASYFALLKSNEWSRRYASGEKPDGWDPELGAPIYLSKDPSKGNTSTGASSNPPAGNLPIGLRSNNPGNLMPGGHMASYPTMLAGMSAMAGNLLAYQAHGIDTLSAIISKWAPAAAGNDVGAYIGDVSKRTGFSANQRLDLRDAGTLKKVMDAMIWHEQGMNPSDVAALEGPAVNGRLGLPTASLAPGAGSRGGNITQTNKTDIHVTGADSADTAQKVLTGQDRVNADAARYLQSIVS